jgi:hypothetical protein
VKYDAQDGKARNYAELENMISIEKQLILLVTIRPNIKFWLMYLPKG